MFFRDSERSWVTTLYVYLLDWKRSMPGKGQTHFKIFKGKDQIEQYLPGVRVGSCTFLK